MPEAARGAQTVDAPQAGVPNHRYAGLTMHGTIVQGTALAAGSM